MMLSALLAELAQRLMREPSPNDLWRLQPVLLAHASPEAETARQLAGQFYVYLSHVSSKLTSKQFSALAAKLAAGALSVISLQEFMESLAADRRKAIASLLGGGVASSLEVLATMQHVKAWDAEFAQEHDVALWDLYAAWWRVSVEAQPGLAIEDRARLIDGLLGPLRNPQTNSQTRLVLILSQFQLLLFLRLAPLLMQQGTEPHVAEQ